MRLRNRIVKATYWTSGELCRWHRDKRDFYRSLWACAEDSCCVEDDMFEVKMTAWPSPLDADMSMERFEAWLAELIEAGKVVPYEDEGRRYLYLPDMARHENPRNPQEPDLPLPPWVTCTITGQGRSKRVTYTHGDPTDPGPAPSEDRGTTVQTHSGNGGTTVQTPSGDRNTSPVLSCPVLSGSVQTVDQTPVPSRSSGPQRTGRGSYPQAEDPGPFIAYWEGKLERVLTSDERASAARWVRECGEEDCRVGLGYAFRDGFGMDLRRVCGQIRALHRARMTAASPMVAAS